MFEFFEIDCLTYKTHRKYDTVIFDPPYGIGMNYEGEFNDSEEHFNENIGKWISDSIEKMSPSGSWFGFIIGEKHYELYNLAIRSGLKWRRTLQWYYEFGQNNTSNFTSLTTPILYMVKSDNFTWRKDAVKLPSARERYGDKRTKKQKAQMNTIITINERVVDVVKRHDPGTFFETLISYPRVMGNFRERAKFSPNQIPVELLMRLISCTTEAGDWVYDPFAGSGSTAIACHFLHRNCVLCDPHTTNKALEHIERYKKVFSEATRLPLEKDKEWTKNDTELYYRNGRWGYSNSD